MAATICVTLWVLPALAQTNAPVAQPSADPKACAPGERLEQGPQGLEAPATTGRGDTASDKLARTDGVICPPNVDPEIRVPPPAVGTTPVIPPPGSPGGDPSIRPK